MKKTLLLHTQWGTDENVSIRISSYPGNKALYIGLVSNTDGYDEPYGDVSVNLAHAAPEYCAYVDTNNMPELEKFITDNRLGEFTGMTQGSGFCSYPLYLFDADRLRELCPEGMAMYERQIKRDVPERKAHAR